MTVALCPGSFDPPTLGHLDVIERTAALFDRVVVAVVRNPSKAPLFSADERMELLRAAIPADLRQRVELASFEGLLVDFARTAGVDAIVKGLRAISDFDYELQMAQMNRHLSGIETLFVPTNPVFGYLSSSLVKEIARFGGAVDSLVPDNVAVALRERLGGTQTA